MNYKMLLKAEGGMFNQRIKKKYVKEWDTSPEELVGAATTAAAHGHLESIKTLVRRGLNLNARASHHSTVLIAAVKEIRVEFSEYMGSSRVNVRELNPLDMVKALLAMGATEGKQHAFIYAAWKGHKEIMQLLLEVDVDVNGAEEEGYITEIQEDEDYDEGPYSCLVIHKNLEMQKGSTALEVAAHNGHTDVVQMLVALGAARDDGGERALMAAASNGRVEIVKILIEAGVDANKQNEQGYTPLMAAVCGKELLMDVSYGYFHEGHVEVVRTLIIAGADVNALNEKGETVLMMGHSSSGFTDYKATLAVRELLLDAGARVTDEYTCRDCRKDLILAVERGDVNVVREMLALGVPACTAALQKASRHPHIEIMQALLEAGADAAAAEIKDYEKQSILIHAAGEGNMYVARAMLAAGADVKERSLHKAVCGGHIEMVRMLLDAGADANSVKTKHKKPPSYCLYTDYIDSEEIYTEEIYTDKISYHVATSVLHKAASKGHRKIVKMLLDAGAEVEDFEIERREKDHVTKEYEVVKTTSAVHAACREGHKETVALLIERGADITGNIGIEALEAAITKRHVEVVRILTKAGIDVHKNTKSQGERSLIEIAVGTGDVRIIQALLDAGADANTKVKYGSSLIEIAVGTGEVRVVQALLDTGANVTEEIGTRALTAAIPHIAMMQMLIGLGVSARNADIVDAVKNECVEAVALLIQEGADVNRESFVTPGRRKCSSLEIAVEKTNTQLVQMLLDARATVTDNAIITGALSGCTEMMQMLLRRAEDIPRDIMTKALETASKRGHTEVVQMFIDAGTDVRGSKALEMAALEGHTEVVTLLVSNGADVNVVYKDPYQRQLPIIAVAYHNGHINVVLALLEAKADISEIGPSLLRAAAYDGQKEIVQAVIKAGVDLSDNLEALEAAAGKGHLEIVKLLLAEGVSAKGSLALTKAVIGICKKMRSINEAETITVRNEKLTPEEIKEPVNEVENEFLNVIHALLDAGVDLSDNLEALELAAVNGHLEVVKLLIEHGVSTRESLALIAAVKGSFEAIQSITSSLRQHTNTSEAEEQIAEEVNLCMEIMQALITAGVDVNLRVSSGSDYRGERFETALGIVLASSSYEHRDRNIEIKLRLAQELLGAGAEVDELDKDQVKELLINAVKHSNLPIVRKLVARNINVNIQDYGGVTPLIIAVRQGDEEMVDVLLEAGADTSMEAKAMYSRTEEADRVSILGEAVNHGHIHIVRTLIGRGIPVTGKELLEAARWRDTEIVQELLTAGAGTEIDTIEQAMIIAAGSGHKEVVQTLMEAGASVQARNEKGNTALIAAVGNGQVEMVQFLVRNTGVEVDATNNEGVTALTIASGQKRINVMQVLIDAGADVDVRGGVGVTALMTASDQQHTRVLQILLTNGASVDARDTEGRTAFMRIFFCPEIRVSFGNFREVIPVLTEAGTDVDARNREDHTALIRVVSSANQNGRRYHDTLEKMQSLLNVRVDIDAICEGDQTPLVLAARSNCHASVAYNLLNNGANAGRRVVRPVAERFFCWNCKVEYHNPLLTYEYDDQVLLPRAKEIGGMSLVNLLMDVGNDQAFARDLIDAIQKKGMDQVLYMLMGVDDVTKTSESKHVLHLNAGVRLNSEFSSWFSNLLVATTDQIDSLTQKTMDIIQYAIDHISPEEQTDEQTSRLSFLFDAVDFFESQQPMHYPLPPKKGPDGPWGGDGGGSGSSMLPASDDDSFGLLGESSNGTTKHGSVENVT